VRLSKINQGVTMAWKKNFRKIPDKIWTHLKSIESEDIVVGCVKVFTQEDIKNGVLVHLNINLTELDLQFPKSIVPLPEQGRYSSFNVYGREIKRTDLPKEKYTIEVETPNWGDSWKGTHTVEFVRERYPREFIGPRNSAIEIECVKSDPELPRYIIKFQISEILNKNNRDFETRLFYCLNMLQENIGNCDVMAAGTSLQDYLSRLYVSWEILPPGTIEEAINRILRGRQPTQQEIIIIQDRYTFLKSLNPQSIVIGSSGFQRYYGGLIRENLIVLENVVYGNAIYIMFENWQELSQKSRIDLLSGKFGHNFERVIHSDGWQDRVKKIIELRRG
jgi:hypothetical protein